MKKTIRFSLIAMVALGLSLGSCKKSSTDTTTTPESTAEQKQMSADEHYQNTETQNSLNEANDAIGTTGFGKAGSVSNATVSVDTPNKKVTVIYNGVNKFGNRSRTGQITVQLTSGSRWKDVGATIEVTYTAFKVTNVLNQKSITFDGKVTVVNQNGGRVFLDSNVTHLATSTAFTVTFDDNTQRVWNLSRQRVFNNSDYSVTETGTKTVGGYSNVIAWGTNRKGDQFYTQITTPIVFNSILNTKCPQNIMSGQKIHNLPNSSLRADFGLDDNGNPVASGVCPTAYKITWTGLRGLVTSIVTY